MPLFYITKSNLLISWYFSHMNLFLMPESNSSVPDHDLGWRRRKMKYFWHGLILEFILLIRCGSQKYQNPIINFIQYQNHSIATTAIDKSINIPMVKTFTLLGCQNDDKNVEFLLQNTNIIKMSSQTSILKKLRPIQYSSCTCNSHLSPFFVCDIFSSQR